MSARHRETERIVAPRLKMADWSGTLSRADTITGSLICSATGWRMALTGTLDRARIIHLTARFDSPTFADDAAPWTDEHEMVKPHEAGQVGLAAGRAEQDTAKLSSHVAPSAPAVGSGQPYDCFWTGTIRKDEAGAWAGEMGDRYGGRLKIEGKSQGNGVMSLRAAVELEEVRG